MTLTVTIAAAIVVAFQAAAPRPAGVQAAPAATAQVMPVVTNATVTTRAAGGGIEAAATALARSEAGPAWAGYAVPAVAGDRWMCCESGSRDGGTWTSYACGCRLEGGPPGAIKGAQAPGERPIRLEGAREMLVLFRIEAGRVLKFRTFSSDCPLDAGGLPLYWLTGVRPADSVAWLSGQARNAGERALARSAVTAIALHADLGADNALRALLSADHPMELRRQAVFWLGQARGRAGFDELRRLSTSEPAAELRRHVAVGLSASKEAGAVPELIRMARQDADAGVRGQALFWIAQKAGERAAPVLAEAIDRDPEAAVRERAVFGLSRLPKDEGVPLLIKVAKSSPDAAVRRRAIFWLGQSRDARALAFFEEILGGR